MHVQEALREQKSAIEKAHASEQGTDNEERWQRFRRRIAELREQKRAKKKSDSHLQKHERQLIARQDILNFLTALAVIGAWLYAGIAAYQGLLMHGQLGQMIEATKQATRSANAAESAAKTAASQFEAAQRPWVTLDAAIDATAKYGLYFTPPFSGNDMWLEVANGQGTIAK